MFPVWYVSMSMVLTDSISGPNDVIDDVIAHHVVIFVATLELNISETQWLK